MIEPTTHQIEREGQLIIEERQLNQLLADSCISELFGGNNVAFLRFLLNEKEGHNLRNKVSHALMSPQEYVLEHLHSVILAMLRLSPLKYGEQAETVAME